MTYIHTYIHTYICRKCVPVSNAVTSPLFGANASNSSKNIMQGFPQDRARKNKSRTAFSLAPMYLFNSSGPVIHIKKFRENRVK